MNEIASALKQVSAKVAQSHFKYFLPRYTQDYKFAVKAEYSLKVSSFENYSLKINHIFKIFYSCFKVTLQ